MITIQKALTDLKAVSRDFNKLSEQTGFAVYGDMSYLEVDNGNAEQAILSLLENVKASKANAN